MSSKGIPSLVSVALIAVSAGFAVGLWAADKGPATAPAQKSRYHVRAAEVPWSTSPSYPPQLQAILRHRKMVGGSRGVIPQDDIFMGEIEQAPRSYYPAHRHPSPEVYYVISGRARWTVGEETFEVGPGSMIYHPSDTDHRIENLGDEPLRSVFLWWAPNGDRSSLRVSSRLTEELRPQPKEAVFKD